MPKYYPINEEAARRAKNANSFSDYVPGSATAAYREMVDRAYTLGKQQKGRVDPMYHEKIDGLIDRYARKLAENINQCNLIDARVPSILIAGGSNFPVRKKEKQNAARDKNMGEYMQIEGLLDKVRSTGMGGISADDDRAVEKLEAKLAGLEQAGKLKAVITQNIDNLHQMAGSKKVLELHGSVYRNYCMKCHRFYDFAHMKASTGVPRCECGGIIKPDVVLYEEGLDNQTINEAVKAISEAQVLIIGGTSLAVYPAAGLIDYFRGEHLVVINKSPTPRDRYADLLIQEPIGQVFSQIHC